jgi:hypothetical protein
MSEKRLWPTACTKEIEIQLTRGDEVTILNGQDCAQIINALLRAGALTINLENVQSLAEYEDAQVDPACAIYSDGCGVHDRSVWIEVDCSEFSSATPTAAAQAKYAKRLDDVVKKEKAAVNKKAAKKKGGK